MKLPHQVLGAAFGRVRAPGARTAAPKVKNCRHGATMISTTFEDSAYIANSALRSLLALVFLCLLLGMLAQNLRGGALNSAALLLCSLAAAAAMRTVPLLCPLLLRLACARFFCRIT